MAALQCEFCGGKLVTKAGGVCECDSCGMEFDKTWVKEKIQEIKGTVKVEGTVQVEGTVKVEGGANRESLLKRGFLALQDKNWDEAKTAFDRVLDIEPENGDARVGMLMADESFSRREQYREALLNHALDELPALKRIFQSSGNETFRQELADYNTMLEEEKRKSPASVAQEATHLATLREQYAPVRRLIHDDIFLLSETGQIHILYPKAAWQVEGETEIVAFLGSSYAKRASGEVICLCETRPEKRVAFDRESRIVEICGGRGAKDIAIRENGTLQTHDFALDAERAKWHNIRTLGIGGRCTIGIGKDGTIQGVFGDSILTQEELQWLNETGVVEAVGDFVGQAYLLRNGKVFLTEGLKGFLDGKANRQIAAWNEIVQIAGDGEPIYGLRADGRVVVAGDNFHNTADEVRGWTDVVAICADSIGVIGIRKDGSVLATKDTECAKYLKTHPKLRLFESIDSLTENLRKRREAAEEAIEKERQRQARLMEEQKARAKREWEEEQQRREARQRERQARREELKAQRDAVALELAKEKGLFAFRRRKELEEQLRKLEAQLNAL